MEAETYQSSLDLFPESNIPLPVLPAVTSSGPNDSNTTPINFNHHERPVRHMYKSKAAGCQLPVVDEHKLLLTTRNPKFIREERLPAMIRDYSICLRPPNPNSWVDDDPLLTSWEPPNVSEIALDSIFDLIPLPQPVRELNFSLFEATNHSAAPLCSRLLDYDSDALGDLQPEHIDEGDPVGHNLGSDSEHEYEDDPDNHPEEDNNHLDEDLEPEINNAQPDIEDGPEDDPEDPEVGIQAVFENHPVLQNIYIRTWIDSVFGGVTREQTRRTLLSHRLALEALPLDAELSEALETMAQSFRSLERKLGVSIDEHLKIYALCGSCGTRYTMDEINNAPEPGCPHVSPGADEPFCTRCGRIRNFTVVLGSVSHLNRILIFLSKLHLNKCSPGQECVK
ncbi:Transposase family Tnp2 protein [Ceratobasidium sp. AG-Ba]|nr:Transposase family Tnp2 protein [Ceratobasidium sp. AG-Ba]